MEKIGIFGGTFNPPHKAHLIVAESVLNQLKLDKIIFVPSYISPLKNSNEIINSVHRHEMVKIAIQSKNNFILSDYEINKKGISYTIDTLKYFKSEFANSELYLIIGADNFNEIDKWKNFLELGNYAKIVAINREKKNVINKHKLEIIEVKVPEIPISSTMIRDKIKGNESIMEFVDENVATYIYTNNLYK